MFSMSSARAPSPASAVATSPDARNSRKASAETAIATSTASPRRFSAKASMKDPSSPQYHVPGSRLSRATSVRLLREPGAPRRYVVDGERAPGPHRERRLAGAHRVAVRGILHVVQIGPDPDRAQIADDHLDLLAIAVAVEIDVEAV